MTNDARFQQLLDSQHLPVKGEVIGTTFKIQGLPADVANAARLLTCLLVHEKTITYDAEGDLPAVRIMLFKAPASIDDSEGTLQVAMRNARERGLC